VNEDERAPLNETPIRFGVFALLRRRIYYGIRRLIRKTFASRYRHEGDPPTE
jgi:hypothetical protein